MLEDNAGQYMYMYLGSDEQFAVTSSGKSAPVNNFYLAEPQQMISLTPKKQQKQVAGKTFLK